MDEWLNAQFHNFAAYEIGRHGGASSGIVCNGQGMNLYSVSGLFGQGPQLTFFAEKMALSKLFVHSGANRLSESEAIRQFQEGFSGGERSCHGAPHLHSWHSKAYGILRPQIKFPA
jgi:hypothetical protein